ncbi:MAG: hypothetical protein GXO65_07610 [Euryarchaeota archaeon]|nr:hypothetical protein [Euryarchaeota archaeon]
MALISFVVFTVPPLNQPLVELGQAVQPQQVELPKAGGTQTTGSPTGETGVAGETPGESGGAISQELTFSWTPVREGITVAQVAQGRSVTCPFEFSGLPPDYSGEVTVEIQDPEIEGMGISLKDIKIEDGSIKGGAVFNLKPGGPVGSKKLVIVVKDDSGNLIGQGVIPFIGLPPGAGGC